MYYVYVMKWKRNNEFYIGYTNDLKQRIVQHKRNGDLNLIYYEAYLSKKSSNVERKKIKILRKRLACPQKKNYGLEGGVLHYVQHANRRVYLYY